MTPPVYLIGDTVKLNEQGTSFFKELMRHAVNPREARIYDIRGDKLFITIGKQTKWSITAEELNIFSEDEA